MQLKADRFTLRGWKPEDAESLQKYANNAGISAYLFDRFPYPYTMQDAIGWVTRQQGQDPLVNFCIAIDDEPVGGVGIVPQDDIYRKTAKIGYWLGEPFWGQGIMPEAVSMVSQYAFENFDLLRLEAGVLSNNPKSMRVLEKCGFVLEGIFRNAIFKRGEVLDEYVYALLRG